MTRPLVDADDRTVSCRVFTDETIFAREQATIFSRNWLCVGHRSQLARAGDFIQSYAGAIPVILCLDDQNQYQVIANVCLHRGSQICLLEQGHAVKFVCPYHNWVYDLRGNVVGMPRKPSPGFDKSKWHLYRADRVATYRDLIFATFSPETVPLEDYLGDMKWYLDLLLNSSSAGTEVSGGAHRSLIHCNWKIPAEQFGADNWHFQGVHGSMGKLGRRNEDPNHENSFHVWMPEGHMLICVAPRVELPSPYASYLDDLLARQQISTTQRRLLGGSIVMTVFPNLSLVFFPGMCSIRLWHPRSAGTTELWSWALYNKDAPADIKSLVRRQVTQMFSPTGILEQDDMEIWGRQGKSLAIMPPSFRLCYGFGVGEVSPSRPYPGTTTSLQSDTPAFAYYQRWAQLVGDGSAADGL